MLRQTGGLRFSIGRTQTSLRPWPVTARVHRGVSRRRATHLHGVRPVPRCERDTIAPGLSVVERDRWPIDSAPGSKAGVRHDTAHRVSQTRSVTPDRLDGAPQNLRAHRLQLLAFPGAGSNPPWHRGLRSALRGSFPRGFEGSSGKARSLFRGDRVEPRSAPADSVSPFSPKARPVLSYRATAARRQRLVFRAAIQRNAVAPGCSIVDWKRDCQIIATPRPGDAMPGGLPPVQRGPLLEKMIRIRRPRADT